MYTAYNISLVAGVAATLNFSFTDGVYRALTGAVSVRGQALQATAASETTLVIPPLPEGLWLLEVRADGHPFIYQHVEVMPSGVASGEGGQSLSVTVNTYNLEITSGIPGPAGPKGEKGDTGPQGAAGRNGTNGTNGKDGKDGATWHVYESVLDIPPASQRNENDLYLCP